MFLVQDVSVLGSYLNFVIQGERQRPLTKDGLPALHRTAGGAP